MACRRMPGAAVLRAAAALTAGCVRVPAAVSAAAERRDLTVVMMPLPGPAGFFIAWREGVFARRGLPGQGRQLADANPAAVECAVTALLPPPGLTQDIAALIWLDSYPAGRAGAVRIQCAAGIMRQFPESPPGSKSRRCCRGFHDGHALAFPDCAVRRRSLGKGGFMGTVRG